MKPPAGMRWVAVDTEVKNLPDKAVPLSSIAQFEVQVPEAATGLKLNFKGDLLASGSASVVLG